MAKTRMRDLVIVLPGITGSVLAHTAGKNTPVDIWAPSGQALWQGLKSLGDSVQRLQVPAHDSRNASPETGFIATRVVKNFHGVLGLGKIDGYTALTAADAMMLDELLAVVSVQPLRKPTVGRA